MRKWLKALLAADFFLILSFGMLTPIYAIFVEQIGGDILDASGAWAIFAFTSGILMYFLGKWEDRDKHYAKILFFGYVLRAAAFLGYFFVQTRYHLFAVQLLLGLAEAVAVPSYDALYSKFLEKGKFAEEWGMWEGMNMIVTAIAALIGGAIATYYGFRSLFLLMFVSGVIGAAIASMLMIKEKVKS